MKYAGDALLALMLLVVFGFLTGILGAPAVESVQNEFANMTDTTTTIETNLTVSNSNHVGISFGMFAGFSVNVIVTSDQLSSTFIVV